MPDAMPTLQRRSPIAQKGTREEFNLPPQGAVYFCPHRPSKYHPSFDLLLRRILERDSQGHLVLLTGRDKRGNDILFKRLRHSFGEVLWKRTIFFPSLSNQRYHRLLSLATVILDSSVYAGGLTSFDAAAYGVPEITLSGPLHIQNFATGIYWRMQLADLPCRTPEEYVDLAVALGTNPEYRREISSRILENNHLALDDRDTVAEHERFFETVLLDHS